jgi:hypothetical protein
MTFTKIPQEALTDAKIAGLSHPAFRLHVMALVFSNHELSDGYVPEGVLSMLVPATSMKSIKAAVTELRNARLWAVKPGGYYILDFTKHQLTKAQLQERRDQKREAALARWYPSSESTPGAHASALQTHSESNGNASASAMPVPRTPFSVPRSSKKNVDTPFSAENASDGREEDERPSRIEDALERVRLGVRR